LAFLVFMKKSLLAGIAALLMSTSATYARPELSKVQSWKLILATWCVDNHPRNEAYVGIGKTTCGEDEQKLLSGKMGIVGEGMTG
jgi:hypothetical protein